MLYALQLFIAMASGDFLGEGSEMCILRELFKWWRQFWMQGPVPFQGRRASDSKQYKKQWAHFLSTIKKEVLGLFF